ncbi:transglycosylase domain-containing protein [Nocardioides sp. Root151]|uniref:transglycosylase domain-containing protein n=1 Tax=Nocardioides sp. Root151 TaxID=1736475 RepID=UPI0009E9AC20|nr:transglycosylase domain-containing protein [Nocardioides sp. Root151]
MTGKRKAGVPARKKPAAGKPDQSPLKRRLKKTLKWTSISGLVLALVGAIAFVVLYRTIDVPDPNADFQTETTKVYYDDGKAELGSFATQNRNSISLDEMPDTIKDAVVAAENQSFWTDKGIDPKGILRAAFSNAKGNAQQGASTITQQYVKILYLSQERSYTRKVKEAIVSLKLQRQQSKEEILEGYLNTIYFGRGAYGIDAAAHAFFDKPAKKLKLRESAVLASVINNPTLFDPANGKANREALLERYHYVLGEMADMDTVPADQAARAEKRLPKFPKVKSESSYAGQRGHMLEMIKKELLRLDFTEQEINGGGLRVTTTLDQDAMKAAEEGVDEARPDGLKELHVASASVEPGTGALRSFYGGQDYLKSQINWAVSGGQPGSSFKPFALAAGIKAGFSLKDTFDGNSPFYFENGTKGPRNEGTGPDGEGNDYGSSVNLIKGTEESINTVYADLTDSIPDGPQKILDMANALGIPKAKKREGTMNNLRDSPGLEANSGIALGSATVSPINMANAYATIANGGEAAPVYVIEKVEDRDGTELYRHKVHTKRVLDEDIAADVSYAMQQVVTNGTGANAQALGRPAAGKTGTATNADDNVSSSWFVGYTPQMATAVMYVRGKGNESLEGYLEPFYGANYPTQTWTAIMSRLMDGKDVEYFPEPVFVDGDAPDDGHAPYVPPPPPPKKTTKPKPKPSKTKSEEPSETPSEKPTKTPGPPSETPTTEPSPTESCTILGGCDEDPPGQTKSAQPAARIE